MKKNKKNEEKLFKLIGTTDGSTRLIFYGNIVRNHLSKRFNDVDRWSDFSLFTKSVGCLEIFDAISNMEKFAKIDPTLKDMLNDNIDAVKLSHQVINFIKDQLFSKN